MAAGDRRPSAADGDLRDADTSGGTAPETTCTYDADGNLHTRTAPKGNLSGATAGSYTTTYGYDPRNNETRYGYDLNHKLTQVTDAAGHTTRARYDLDGLLTQQTDANGSIARRR